MSKNYLIFLGLMLCMIFYPFIVPGHFFSLDQVFPYYYTFPTLGSHNYWLHIIGAGFSELGIPSWILEKLVYVGLFSTIIYFGYKLVSHLKHDIAKLFCILFLLINPFFYARFIEGQINVYLSYGFFIMFFYFVIQFFHNKKYNYWSYISLISLLLCLTSIHNIFIIALVLCIYGAIYLFKEKGNKVFYKKSFLLAFSLVLLNSLWVLPVLQRDDLTGQIENFGENHRNAFSSIAGTYDNIYLNQLALKGYWGESENRFARSELNNQYFFFIFLIILGLVLAGAISGLKKKNNFHSTLALLSIASITFVLALGVSGNNIFSSFNSFLFQYIPFYTGFREPHKWLILLTIIYAYLGALGVEYIYTKIQSVKKLRLFSQSFIVLIAALPIVYTPVMLLGIWGQVSPKIYPVQWQEIKSYTTHDNPQTCLALSNDVSTKCYNTLIFPWHGYLRISWTQRPIVISGIFKYFGEEALYGDTIEIGNIYSQSPRPESRIIEKYIPIRGKDTIEVTTEYSEAFTQDIKSLGIKNIVLLKESTYAGYLDIMKILEETAYISIIYENEMGIVYKLN